MSHSLLPRGFWLGFAAYLLPSFPIAYVWHLIAFAPAYHALAIYREEVIENGLALFAGLLKKGMATGEFRTLPIPHAVRLCIAPVLLGAIWRTTFAQLDSEPYDYAGLIETHIATLLRGLKRGESDA